MTTPEQFQVFLAGAEGRIARPCNRHAIPGSLFTISCFRTDTYEPVPIARGAAACKLRCNSRHRLWLGRGV
jgi:hypothetical protein